MSSASLRRSVTSSDPRSPLQLSSLVTSFPQHQIITSFQTFQAASPTRYSPRRLAPSPVSARYGARALSRDLPDPSPPSARPARRKRSPSIARLLSARSAVPGFCACGHGSKSIKHLVKDCPRFEAERERLIERDPDVVSPVAPSVPGSTTHVVAQQPQQQHQKNLVQAVRRRTRTLLGKYNIVDTQKQGAQRRSTMA